MRNVTTDYPFHQIDTRSYSERLDDALDSVERDRELSMIDYDVERITLKDVGTNEL